MRWGWGLAVETANVLLDKSGPADLEQKIRAAIEADGKNHIADLHVWSIGPDLYSVIVSVVARDARAVDHYKQLICADRRVAHISVEVLIDKD
jgi:Co/Zn/Cd efflux system component